MFTKKNQKGLFLFSAAVFTIAFICSFRASDIPFADRIITYLFENGRRLSPSYKQADCSTLMTRTLEHYFTLTVADRRQINISFDNEGDKQDFWMYFKHKSNCLTNAEYICDAEVFSLKIKGKRWDKLSTDESVSARYFQSEFARFQEKRLSGVAGFIESKGGQRIDAIGKTQKGDFVQFWHTGKWGHCGVVQSVDTVKRTLTLHSSFPSTDGYGIQPFPYNEQTFFYIARVLQTEK